MDPIGRMTTRFWALPALLATLTAAGPWARGDDAVALACTARRSRPTP